MKISVFYHHILEAANQEHCTEDEIFKKIKSAGITAVELDRDGVPDAERFCETLKKHDFCVSNIYGFYNFSQTDDLENCKKHIKLAKAVKADKIMIVPGFYSKTDEVVKKIELKKMIQGTKKLCGIAKENGIKATIEDFDDEKSPLCSLGGIADFLNQIPSLYVTFDTGNFIISGEDELMALEMLKSRIIHVHCKDRDYEENGKVCASTVGGGGIKISEIFNGLIRMNYSGIITIEHFEAGNYLEFMLKSAEWINRKMEDLVL
jgi:L-ribulose-5-phosphate 3-epimerase